MSFLVTRRSDVRDEVFGADRAFRKARVSRGCPIALLCVGIYTTGSRTGVARSVGKSNLASRQPSRQPSSQTSRHTAGVKRLELMACQPAGPVCCDSFRPWTRACVLLSGTMHPSHCCISRGSLMYVLTLSFSGSYVELDTEAHRRGIKLLAGVHSAHVGTRCVIKTARRRFW